MKQGYFCFCLSYDSKGFWLLTFAMLLKDMKENITIWNKMAVNYIYQMSS